MRRHETAFLSRAKAYAVAVAYAAVGLAVTSLSVKPLAGPFFMFQFAAVVGAALHGGLGPGMVAIALSALGSLLMFFIPTIEAHEVYRLASFLLVSVFFAGLAARTRRARAAAEEARQRAEAAEAEARRIGDQQERLVAVVSHDIRNPLNAILVTAEHLQRQGNLSERQASSLSRVVASARRMQSMIRDLLDYARARHAAGLPVHRQAVRVGDVCRSALEEVRVVQPSGRVTLAVSGDDSASLDPSRLEQLVCNLVTNALKHGAADAPVAVTVTGEGDRVQLQVQNEGAPIPRNLLPNLFDPFRAGDAAGSVGLGLYIVREIALAHGGQVSVDSSEQGTAFTVTLPRGLAGGVGESVSA
jgi:signal transduction histidine kinase